MINYNNLAHIAFNVTDMDRALKFYCDGLGMKVAYGMGYDTIYERFKRDIEQGTIPEGMGEEQLAFFEEMKDKPWMYYIQVKEGQFIELFYTYQGEQPVGIMADKCGYQHCCLEVDDLEAVREEIIKNGIVPVSEIQMGPDYSKQFWVEDPDGNRIEMMQYTEKSYQLVKAVTEA